MFSSSSGMRRAVNNGANDRPQRIQRSKGWTHRVAPLLFASALIACGGSPTGQNPAGENPAGGGPYPLFVVRIGTGSGRVTSSQSVGIDCGSACSASLDEGNSVTLTAAPAAGSDFTGWSGSCSGTGACVLTMDSAKAVTARFSLSRITFYSARKLDGTDARNANGTSNIWRLNVDGSGLRPLTNATASGAGSFDPQWSPDGTKVVFASYRKLDGTDARNANGTYNIWLVNADGSGLTPLTRATAVGAHSYGAQWSPDGTKVVFASYRKLDGTDARNPNGTPNIWRVNADGSGLAPITTATAAFVESYAPQWSPDGAKVAFISTRKLDGTDAPGPNQTANIWRVNADGSGLTHLTHAIAAGADSYAPQWSPDGAKVVFISRRKPDGTDAPNPSGTENIWRANADGTSLTPLTNATAVNADSDDPQWSPDGAKVVFSSTRALDGSDAPNPNDICNIWRVNADGTGLTPVTHATAAGADSGGPQWSPDGAKVVFSSRRKLDGTDGPNTNRTQNIWIVNADGTGLAPLTNVTASQAGSFGPMFSP